jgi:arylsulfatase A-like enzyme
MEATTTVPRRPRYPSDRLASLRMAHVSRLAALAVALGWQAAQAPANPPNVIVVLTDDQGYGDLGIHGNQHIRTPNIDRFAREGARFERFYVSPVCAPTRASLMTGRYYYRSGVIHTSRGAARMHGDETTLAEMLKKRGYRTGIFGKWHLGDNYPMRPIDQGFEEALVHKSGGITQSPDQPNSYFDPLLWRNGKPERASGYCTDVFFDAALDFIGRHRGEPFFAYIATNAPHTPLEVAEDLAAPYRRLGLDDTTARIYGMVENIDRNFGRLLERLEEWGLRDNTLIVFFTDNGPQQPRFNAGLRDLKTTTYEGGIRVPSFWQWPGRIPSGRTIRPIAAHIDIAPTILEAAGAEPPAGRPFDGRSLLPLLSGSSEGWPARTLFFQVHRGLTPTPYQNAAVVNEDYKLVLGSGTFSNEDLQIADPVLELYDLSRDPGESHSLAAREPDRVADLKKRYDAWFRDVRSSRGFAPGLIHLGSDAEPEAVLCVYQDARYFEGRAVGWPVFVERAGTYEFTLRRAPAGPAELVLRVDGRNYRRKLESGQRAARFDLPAGRTEIDVWVEQNGRPLRPPVTNSNEFDVIVRRLP